MKTTTYKQIVDILTDSTLDFKATALEVAKSYPSIFAKCAVTSKTTEVLTRAQEERKLVMKYIPNGDFIMAIKELKAYRIKKDLPAELCGLYICKTECEQYRKEYNEQLARSS